MTEPVWLTEARKLIGVCWFPNQTMGVRGYCNRVLWMIRNPLYGLADLCGRPEHQRQGAPTRLVLRSAAAR